MSDNMPSTPRKTDFVTTTPLMPSSLDIKCKCGKMLNVSLDDPHLKETIMAHPCCNEDAPLEELKQVIELFSQYIEARATLGGRGWDIELYAPPWNCKA